jgi:hypothetical protein
MAAPAKQTSRWGSLLQQAVAGVESRLDNILAEGAGEGGVGDDGLQAKKPPVATSAPVAAKSESSMMLLLICICTMTDELALQVLLAHLLQTEQMIGYKNAWQELWQQRI